MPDIETEDIYEIPENDLYGGALDRVACESVWETRSGRPCEPPEKSPETAPVTLYSFGFEAEDLLAVYGALRVYLRTLAGQESEDLEMLGRVVRLMNEIRPAAVKASKTLSLKAAGRIEDAA